MDYNKSFSGTDTLAFIMMPGCTPVVIGSLTTISYSMFRNKKPVINIGRTNINGVTRGSRIFAGTMIFTLINQHWLRDLQEQEAVSYLKDFKELKVDELPLFDIMIVSANEYGSAVSMYIYGIDFTDEAQTISVEDLFTENTFSFVARDLSTFEKLDPKYNLLTDSSPSDDTSGTSQTVGNVDSSYTDIEGTEPYVPDNNKKQNAQPTIRDLYLNTSNFMIGDDVMQLQLLLSELYPNMNVANINGVFDEQTDRYVKIFQSEYGMQNVDGIVDNTLYNYIRQEVEASNGVIDDNGDKVTYSLGIVVNASGTFCYDQPTYNSNTNSVLYFKEKIEILDVIKNNIDGYEQKWYKTPYGYIDAKDVYSVYGESQMVTFPTIRYEDEGVYVTMVQSLLEELFPDYTPTGTGIYDYETINKVNELKELHGLKPDGVVDEETWRLLREFNGSIYNGENNFVLKYNVLPGVYTISTSDTKTLAEQMQPYYVTISCDNVVTTKSTIVSTYPNGNTKSFSINEIGDLYDVSMENLQSALVYDEENGAMPISLEWTVYPLNRVPYKWTFNIT